MHTSAPPQTPRGPIRSPTANPNGGVLMAEPRLTVHLSHASWSHGEAHRRHNWEGPRGAAEPMFASPSHMSLPHMKL
eukprot:6538675-Pyramimonas_sp.AAC.1